MVRYTQTGTIDSTFGKNGKLAERLFHYRDICTSVALQPDGKIVAAGYSTAKSTNNSDFALVRYKPNGKLDMSFGKKGKVSTDVAMRDNGNSVSIQADGKILLAGNSGNDFSSGDFSLLRYNVDGKLDSSFGGSGMIITDFGSFDAAKKVALQSNQKIVVAGYSTYDSNFYFVLARYKKNGNLDESFGTNGKVLTYFPTYGFCSSAAIQADDKIVVVGSAYKEASVNNFILVRYNDNGIPDSTFGKNSKTTTDFGSYDYAQSVAIQADGKIVVAGTSGAFFQSVFAVSRYNSDVSPLNVRTQNSLNIISSAGLRIKIYPNPFQSVLNIEFNNAGSLKKTINIYDVSGKMLITKSAEGNTQLDVKQLTAGAYLIKINDETGKVLYNGKAVKQ